MCCDRETIIHTQAHINCTYNTNNNTNNRFLLKKAKCMAIAAGITHDLCNQMKSYNNKRSYYFGGFYFKRKQEIE